MPQLSAVVTAPRRRPRLPVLVGTSGLVLALLLTMAPTAGADPRPSDVPGPQVAPGRYVVTMAAAPLAAYDGRISGLAATQPEDGERVDVRSTAAKRYLRYLKNQQDEVAELAGLDPDERFAVGISAFTATMTAPRARAVAKTPGVLGVTKDTRRHLTDKRNSVDYLKLSGRNGVWADLGGTSKAGRGVVIGVLDSGIWPENRSFAGRTLRTEPTIRKAVPFRSGSRTMMRKSDGKYFVGTCQAGEQFTPADCNSKLIGARAFGEGYKAAASPEEVAREFDSPRDRDGHGSHTAGTAGGNARVPAVVEGINFGRISGVAPAAKIAAYKVCWGSLPEAATGCYTTDLLAGIEAAIIDGVDVINYSISGSQQATDPVELSFLSAASAGIFVAASAGNSGPTPSTTNHESPWVTSVAASTIAPYYGTVTLGNGWSYLGASTTVTRDVTGPLANSSALGAAGQTAQNVALCVPNSLDPARTAGKIVVCDRGVIDRVVKSTEVERAGGIGMVLANPFDSSLDPDLHAVPSVHVNPPASSSIKTYAGSAGATATLRPGNQTSTAIPYPQVAGFSSRGPAVAPKGDLLKPDLSAPGVAILAAVSPVPRGRSFDFNSGTSMASPHVAGLAALWYGVRPLWSPMKVKSALMTTARNTRTATGARNRNPFDQGAGEVRPTRMFNPGLVYPAGDRDWNAYLEGQGVDTGTGVAAQKASDYNAPSIAIGNLTATQTVTRRLEAIEPGRYRVRASVPGTSVRVTPRVLKFSRKGQVKTYRVTFANRTAPLDQAATGFLTWRGAGNRVRIPVAVTPRFVVAPAAVGGSGGTGSVAFPITPGVTGDLPLQAYGLAEGEAQQGSVAAGESDEFPYTVPASTKVAQFSVRTPNAGADLDLYLYRLQDGAATLVAQSATGAAGETITLPAPAAGEYVVLVDGFSDEPGSVPTPYTFRASSVQSTGGLGNFTVSPNPVRARAGVPVDLQVSWDGLSDDTPYVGLVEYPNGRSTIVSIN